MIHDLLVKRELVAILNILIYVTTLVLDFLLSGS